MITRRPQVSSALVGLAATFFIGVLATASEPAGAQISIHRWTLDGGGSSYIQAGSFVLGATIGQPDAGLLVGSGYAVRGGFWATQNPVTVAVKEAPVPGSVGLPPTARIHPAAPDPMTRSTRLSFELPHKGQVVIRVFNVNGGLVRTLMNERRSAGEHACEWNALDDGGRRVSPGLYFIHVQLGELKKSLKLIILR